MTFENLKPEDIFNCRKCGDCCKGYGGTFITEKEIETIAAYIREDFETFVKNYCRISGGKKILAQAKNMYCIFWDGVCTIHPVKPRMCKTWPFLESILVDIGNWHIMASLCPGIRTDVPNGVVKKCVVEKLSKNL